MTKVIDATIEIIVDAAMCGLGLFILTLPWLAVLSIVRWIITK